MFETFFTALMNLTPALIAAAASIITVVFTQYRSKRLSYFQTFFARKLDAYSEFWASVGCYEQEGAAENQARLHAALHTVCLFAPIDIYEKVLNVTNKLQETSHLTGEDIQVLMDLMRLDLDQCRRLEFTEIEPVDPELKRRKKCWIWSILPTKS